MKKRRREMYSVAECMNRFYGQDAEGNSRTYRLVFVCATHRGAVL